MLNKVAGLGQSCEQKASGLSNSEHGFRLGNSYLMSITWVADWLIIGGLSPVTSKRNSLKSQMTANCRSQPFLIPPGFGI